MVGEKDAKWVLVAEELSVELFASVQLLGPGVGLDGLRQAGGVLEHVPAKTARLLKIHQEGDVNRNFVEMFYKMHK